MNRDSADSFRTLLLRHVARYPRLEAVDIYKLLHQGCCGPEHAVGDDAARRLVGEAATLREAGLEPVVEPLPPAGAFVRVHLRAYLQSGGGVQELAAAFTRSAAHQPDGRAALAVLWSRVIELAAEGLLPFGAATARDFWERRVAAGFGPVHHSERFREAYVPAYRVLTRDEAMRLAGARNQGWFA